MAGKGRAPKAETARRNHHAPRRGDWIVLAPIENPKPSPLPARGNGRGRWSERTRRAWEAWWSDPASAQWGTADIDLLEHLADVYEEWVRQPRSNMATEIRQLRDSLGLSPKGKRDLRLRVADPAEVLEHPTLSSRSQNRRRRLVRAVDPALARQHPKGAA